MTARDVYEQQQALRRAEVERDNLADLLSRQTLDAAHSGAFVGSQEWQHDPAYRDLAGRAAALTADVTAAQAAVGGVVFRVADANLDALRKKLDALRKRAAKHDLGSLTYRVTEEHDRVEVRAPWDPEACAALGVSALRGGEVIGVRPYTFVVIQAGRLKIAGWALLAKLTVENAGVFVTKVPAFARAGWDASEEQLAAAKAHLEGINLGGLDPDKARDCDHCGLDRRRAATYVVEHLDTGERKQVGSACLRDFLGVDPNQFARYAEHLSDLEAALESDGEGGYGGGRVEVSVRDYLVHVCTMLRVNGWAARSGSDYPTAAQAEDNRFHYMRQTRGKTGPLWVGPTDADADRADAALAWADVYLGAKVNQSRDASEFDHNLYVAASNGIVTPRTQGTLAYLPVAHARFLEREIELARDADSDYVGEVGQRVELTLTVTHVFEYEGSYGTTFITVFRDAAGDAFKWFGSYGLDVGSTYVGKWTVKSHEEYKGVKQTLLNRPAKLAPADAAQQVLA